MTAGKLLSHRITDQTVTVQFQHLQAVLQVITPQIIRIHQKLDDIPRVSKAIEGDKTLPTEFSVEEREDCLLLRTDDLCIWIFDDFYLDIFDAAGNLLCADYRGQRKLPPRISPEHAKQLEAEGHSLSIDGERVFHVVKAMPPAAHFYGLGDKTGFLDKRNYDYEMWNTDDPKPHVDSYKALYKTIPFFTVLAEQGAYGIFMDNTYKSYFNMGQESRDYFWFGSEGGDLDYYFLAGPTLPRVLENYCYLTGTCPVPQKWALGYHQSRWGYVNQEDVEAVAEGMRSHDIPCDVLHFDIDYMDGFRVFTWNRDRYHGDPKAFLASLARRGFKSVVINDPGVKKDEGYHIYDEGIQKGFFAKSPEGQVYSNYVWPGESVFPDFGKAEVRQWWGDHQKFLLETGVRGVWNDMNEPASFHGPLPDDVVFSDEARAATHREMHNVYGHLMSKAAYEGLKRNDGRRPFVITRACYAGSQKYTTAWTGDNTSLWSHLQMTIPQLCNLGLSGMPFVGTDIGGFGADTTPELLARWVQVGCFSPLFRNHSSISSLRQEPWLFGEEVLNIYRKYVKLRYRLIPYYYDLCVECERTGAPMMRPLVYHFQNDEAAKVCNDEFMLGSRMLIAPVVHPGADRRMVYLPEGTWYDYWTREQLQGPCWFIREAPLDVCPIYVRAGSVLPMMEPCSFIPETPPETLLLDVFPGEGSWDHYLDNGQDFAYRQGQYHHYRFTVDVSGNVRTQILHDGYQPYSQIRVIQPSE